MNYLKPQHGDIPGPAPQAATARFWEGCQQHQLLYLECSSCGQAVHAPAIVCFRCHHRDLLWSESKGLGELYSWTRVWRPQRPAFEVPYVAIIVELDEGWSLVSNLIHCDADDASIGMRVQVDFQALANGAVLPYFRPAETAAETIR